MCDNYFAWKSRLRPFFWSLYCTNKINVLLYILSLLIEIPNLKKNGILKYYQYGSFLLKS